MAKKRSSINVAKEKLKQIKQIFPEVFTENKIDFDQLKAVLGEVIETNSERYGLNWAGKSECMKIIQEPSIATLKPSRSESVDFDNTENVYIEGENLEVLKLLQESYFGKIKMIYIDPPYNTGKDFVYKDKFGSSKNGINHSNWLNMMYPRLYLARNLLRDDGVIFISIDDHEVANLRAVCDQVFGEENLMGCIVWNSTKSVTNTALISVSHSHILCYAKVKTFFVEHRRSFRLEEDGEGFSNPDNDPRGRWKADPFQVGGWRPNQQYEIQNPITKKIYLPNSGCSWKNDHKAYLKLLEENKIVFGCSGEGGPLRKRFLSEAKNRGKVIKTLWSDLDTTTNATEELKRIFQGKTLFSHPKPIDLLQRIITIGDHTKEGFILDFFSGSATTAHAVMALNAEDNGNRKYIMVQLPEATPEHSEARNSGYLTIADIGKERIRRAARKIKEAHPEKRNLDLGFKVLKLEF